MLSDSDGKSSYSPFEFFKKNGSLSRTAVCHAGHGQTPAEDAFDFPMQLQAKDITRGGVVPIQKMADGSAFPHAGVGIPAQVFDVGFHFTDGLQTFAAPAGVPQGIGRFEPAMAIDRQSQRCRRTALQEAGVITFQGGTEGIQTRRGQGRDQATPKDPTPAFHVSTPFQDRFLLVLSCTLIISVPEADLRAVSKQNAGCGLIIRQISMVKHEAIR
jgi:hypothetical protein